MALWSGLLGKSLFWTYAYRRILARSSDFDAIWLHQPILPPPKALWERIPCLLTYHSTYRGFLYALADCRAYSLLPYYSLATLQERALMRSLNEVASDPLANVKITTVSDPVSAELRSQNLRTRTFVIPNGSNPSNLVSSEYARQRLRELFHIRISDESSIFLYVGRLTEVKQSLALVKFIERVREFIQDARLIIAGSGNLYNAIHSSIAKSHSGYMLGTVDRGATRLLMAAANAFVNLSCYEGLPLALLDAASSGLPLLLSDIPGHRYLLESKFGEGVLLGKTRGISLKIDNDTLGKISNLVQKRIKTTAKPPSWREIARRYVSLIKV